MFSRFLPHEFSFFDMFEEQAKYTVEAATLFKELVTKGNVGAEAVEEMRKLEHSGDQVAHKIIDRINRTFITPFDREDIYTLTKELDDVIDILNTIVGRLHVYHLTSTDKNLIEFAAVIEVSAKQLATAICGLRTLKNAEPVMAACVEVHRLENVGDAMRDTVLAKLFETEKDPIAVIKWKEIYEHAETTLDICEDVANIVESILVKQA